MIKLKPIVLVLLLGLLLSACFPVATPTLPATAPAETTVSAPAPTGAAPTGAAATQPAPAATDTSPPPQASATAVTPGQTQPEAIAILQPGPGSSVTSPLTVSGIANPTFEQSLAITILLADGITLATGSAQIGADVGQRGPFTAQVPFSVSQEQPGFIQVYAVSAKDGGVTHLASVGVTLAPGGAANLVPAQEGTEQIQILQPVSGATVGGGVLHVEGFGLATFEQTLAIDLLDESGNTIVTTPVLVSAPDLGQPGPFSADLPYSLSVASMSARVQVRDVSPAHGGNTHLTSVEITLRP